jgi:DNA repair protein RadC
MSTVPIRTEDASQPLPVEPKPRALARAGAASLRAEGPDAALLLALVSSAAPELHGALSKLLEERGITALARVDPDHWRRLVPLSRAQSVRLAAAFALGRSVESARSRTGADMRSPARVSALLAAELRGLAQETFHVLLLDGKHRLRRRERISAGTLTSSLVHPREVFGPALREGAAALIVAHNHPSGDPEPSSEDLAVTRRLIEAGRLVGIPLVDHVVIGEGGFVSLRERMPFS